MSQLNGNFQDLPVRVLAIRSKNGNCQAFGELYTRFATKIYRFIYFKVSSHEVAEDLSHEVFLKAWQHIDSVNEDSFQAWIFTIARNKVIDHYRTRKNNQPLHEQHGIDHSDLVDSIHTKLESQKAAALIPLLRQKYQDIIILRIMQDLTVKEVSEVLQISPQNVRVITHRALKELKKLYDQ